MERRNSIKLLRNERGMALVTSLLLTFVSLAILMGVMYLLTQGAQVSAAHKRYKTVLDAAHGGVDVLTKDIMPLVLQLPHDAAAPTLDPLLRADGAASPFANYSCFRNKLNTPTAGWAFNDAAHTSTNAKEAPDVVFTLRAADQQPNFKVYSKIVDTVPGNSDTSGNELLDSGAGVAYGNSGVSPQHVPAIYRIEVQGERATDPQETSKLTVLYAY